MPTHYKQKEPRKQEKQRRRKNSALFFGVYQLLKLANQLE